MNISYIYICVCARARMCICVYYNFILNVYNFNNYFLFFFRYNLAYIVFYVLGINTLIPWSFFITADDYWMYKFREIHENSSKSINYTHVQNLEKRTDLQASFTSYLSVASAVPNTFFLIINAFINKR